MIPTNKQEFIEFCLRKLGEPVIKVNVDPAQIDDRVTEALYMFYDNHYHAVEGTYALFTLTDAEMANTTDNYVLLPEDIVGVSEVYRFNNSSNIWSIDFQYQLAELYSLSNVMRYGGINYYYTQRMHLELLEQLFSPERQFDFNYLTHKLIIQGGLQDLALNEAAFVLKCFRKIEDADADEDTSDSTMPTGNIWKDRWLQQYATELIRENWAQNMSKYQNIQLLGGVVMDGNAMKAEARERIKELEDDLRDKYSLPCDFIVG